MAVMVDEKRKRRVTEIPVPKGVNLFASVPVEEFLRMRVKRRNKRKIVFKRMR